MNLFITELHKLLKISLMAKDSKQSDYCSVCLSLDCFSSFMTGRARLLNLQFCWTSFMQNTPFHCPPMHPSHRALAICTRRAPGDIFVLCLTHRAPVIYMPTPQPLSLSVSFCPIHLYPLIALAHCPFLSGESPRTHTPAHTHVGGRTRGHAKEVASSHGECRREVSNPVPGIGGPAGGLERGCGWLKRWRAQKGRQHRRGVRTSNCALKWTRGCGEHWWLGLI